MEERMQLDAGANHLSLQPNYSCTKVKEALEHLATIDMIDLCNEAKVEYCRATRDLRSCGCSVQSMLNSCGHASLCDECSQRSDVCPICRVCIPETGNRLSLRLYYECIEAGLISKRYDDRVQEKDGEKQLTADVERLYLFFDVALENNLLSLICHYITDVCMDESAVSSDPVVALLLDEVVVKDWCKRTFKKFIAELKPIYNLNVGEMKERSNLLLKFAVRLGCIFTVFEVLESSFKGSLSSQLQDIHHLQESVLKTKQVMAGNNGKRKAPASKKQKGGTSAAHDSVAEAMEVEISDWSRGVRLSIFGKHQKELYLDKISSVPRNKLGVPERFTETSDFKYYGLLKCFQRLGWEAVLTYNNDNKTEIYIDEIVEWMSTVKKEDGKNPPFTTKLLVMLEERR